MNAAKVNYLPAWSEADVPQKKKNTEQSKEVAITENPCGIFTDVYIVDRSFLVNV